MGGGRYGEGVLGGRGLLGDAELETIFDGSDVTYSFLYGFKRNISAFKTVFFKSFFFLLFLRIRILLGRKNGGH